MHAHFWSFIFITEGNELNQGPRVANGQFY